MSKRPPQNSLYVQLLFYLLLAAVIAFTFCLTAFHLAEKQIDEYTSRPDRVRHHATRHVRNLQTYITREKLSRTDVEALALWNDENWYTSINISDADDNSIIYYDSFLRYAFKPVGINVNDVKEKDGIVTRVSWDGLPYPCFTYPLRFVDGNTTVTISGPFGDQYAGFSSAISTTAFLLVFVLCFFLLCRRRFAYIQVLQNEIETICRGNLSHKLPVTGNDELTTLASYINDMSRSLQERIQIEKDIRKKNSEVVAVISHDLRTPLTSVICYLDLLQDGRYPDEDTKLLYINNARTRAYQIKSMSDELFARSVQKLQKDTLQLELLCGSELISHILSEMRYALSENGFTADFHCTFPEIFNMWADVVAFRRIFDNLTTNIIKYADPAIPVSLSATLSDDKLFIIQRNIKSQDPNRDSSGLGLSATRLLVLSHQGSFEIKDNRNLFEIHLTFSVINSHDSP